EVLARSALTFFFAEDARVGHLTGEEGADARLDAAIGLGDRARVALLLGVETALGDGERFAAGLEHLADEARDEANSEHGGDVERVRHGARSMPESGRVCSPARGV